MSNYSQSYIFIFLFITLSICSYAQEPMDSVFINWNKTTFQSLERQKLLQHSSKAKSVYKNRLSALKLYLGIGNTKEINHASIRYSFLDMLFSEHEYAKSTFLVIEADKLGYMTTLSNFVVWVDSSKNVRIEFYNYINGEWKKVGGCYLNDFYIDFKLKNYFTKLNTGFNKDDVIITLFSNNAIIESEYYLYSTLSTGSNMKRIIDTYKKENLYSP
jgi:hypothetical protein